MIKKKTLIFVENQSALYLGAMIFVFQYIKKKILLEYEKRFEYQTKSNLVDLWIYYHSWLAKLSKESFYSTRCRFNHRNEQKTRRRLFLKIYNIG